LGVEAVYVDAAPGHRPPQADKTADAGGGGEAAGAAGRGVVPAGGQRRGGGEGGWVDRV
jgi:hypothetical protein